MKGGLHTQYEQKLKFPEGLEGGGGVQTKTLSWGRGMDTFRNNSLREISIAYLTASSKGWAI